MTCTFTLQVPDLPRLTPREQSILRCLGLGMTTKEIATELNLSEMTAREYVTALMRKTRYNRHQLGVIGFLHFHTAESTWRYPA